MEYTPSEYQKKIYDFVLHGAGNAFISAKAGSGKTTTMVEAMKLVPEKEKCIFLAFNKNIVEELSKKVEDHKNCNVSTVHSLGLSILKSKFGEITVDELKYDTYFRENIKNISDPECLRSNRRAIKTYYKNIRKLVDLSRLFLCQSESEISKLAEERGIQTLCDEADVASSILEWGRKNVETVDYTDMVWLPNELLLKPPKRYDWVFCDEVQDFSLAYYSLVEKCIKRGGRLFSVGDEKQMINGFAGASEKALEKIVNRPNTKTFQLPICYRCDRSIVALAKKYASEITCREDADEGKIMYNRFISEIKSGDLVLSRTNAPLAKLYMTFLKNGVKCNMLGKTMVEDLIPNVEASGNEQLNPDVFEKGVFYDLYLNLFTCIKRIAEVRGIHKEDAMLLREPMMQYDSIQTLRILSDGLNTKEELLERLRNIGTFEPDETVNEKGITLSTIHKAKGTEYDRVFILCDPSLPLTDEMPEWEKEQEKNLTYVAYTRAKHYLGFIDENEVPKCGRQMPNEEILKDMLIAETLVMNIKGEPISENEYTSEAIKKKVDGAVLKKEKEVKLNIITTKPFEKRKGPSLLDLSKYRKNEA